MSPAIPTSPRKIGGVASSALLLRSATLVDVDSWTRVPGEPLRPGAILEAIRDRMPVGDAA